MTSGVPPIDRVLGGLPRGRILLLGGATGSGKSAACLQFLDEALRRGETAALITQHRAADVRAHAARLGIDLRAALRDGRFVLLRFAPSFASTVIPAAATDAMLEELERALEPAKPARIAIDTLSPLLAGGPRAAARLEALGEMLERAGATSLLACTADVAVADHALEPLVQRSAAILRLSRESAGHFRLERVNVRYAPAELVTVCYTLRGGRLECVEEVLAPVLPASAATVLPAASELPALPAVMERPLSARAAQGTPAVGRAQEDVRPHTIVLLHATESPDDALRAFLDREFEVQALPATSDAIPSDVEAILIETSHATLAASHATLRALAGAPGGPPLLVVSRYALRSIDRARLLRAGADDCLVHETGAAEFLARLDAATVRRHAPAPTRGRDPARDAEETRRPGAAGGILDLEAFARSLAEHVTRDDPVQYTVVSIAPAADEISALPSLVELVCRTMRSRSGDLATVHEESVLVYLHGALRNDVSGFLVRLRHAWSAMARRPLRVESLTYPADEPHLQRLFITGSVS